MSTGTVSRIADLPTVASGATWSAEGIVVFAARYGIFSVPAAGGTPMMVAGLNRDKQENQLVYPQFLPDNRHFLYVARSGRPQQSGAYVGSLDSKPIRLFSTTSFVRYAPPGYLLSVRDGALVAQPFNPITFAIGTEATTIVRQIKAQGALNGRFDVSPNGLLAYFAQRTAPSQLLRWFDRAGNSLGDLTETAYYNNFRIAPDGLRVVVDRRSDDDATGGRSVWIYETDGQPATRVTFGGIDEWHPVWSPDAQRLAFMSYRDGPGDIYVKSLAAPAPEEPLIADEDQTSPSDWSPDGRFLAYWIDRTDSRQDVWVLPVAPRRAHSHRANVVRRAASQVLTRWPVHRVRIGRNRPHGSVRAAISTNRPEVASVRDWWHGACVARRRALVQRSESMLVAVPVTASGSAWSPPGRAVPLFQIPIRSLTGKGFDISPDGRRVLVQMVTPAAPQPLMIVLNWMALLKN